MTAANSPGTATPVTALRPAERAPARARILGFVFQSYYLTPELDALENVLLARRLVGPLRAEDTARARDLLGRVGLGQRLRHAPGKLSGGEAQRVAVARALLNRPRLLLADEPTGNLDERSAEEVISLLLRLCAEENTALVLVTHHAGFAARAARALRLEHGVLVAARPPVKSPNRQPMYKNSIDFLPPPPRYLPDALVF